MLDSALRAVLVVALLGVPALQVDAQELPFAITVVDAATGAPVPCVELRTTHKMRFRSDSAGRIAFYEPGLLGEDVWFETAGPPWELPGDFLGFPGVTLSTSPGGAATVEVTATAEAPPCTADDRESRLITDGLPPLAQRHGLQIVDADTGRGLPLVEVRQDGRTWVTDSAGWVAFLAPTLLGSTTTFEVVSHGFEPSEPLTLTLTPGGRSSHALTRRIPAERLYRVTGGGIYRDSVLLGESTPLAEPTLNALVTGLDSTHTAVYRGEVFWIWGDTLRASYPLGHFKTSAAVSALPPDGLDPDRGIDLRYFTRPEDGFARPVADIADEGLIWISGLVTVPGQDGEELLGQYAEIAGEGQGAWSEAGTGMVRWDPVAERFDELVRHEDLPAMPKGTAFVEGDHVYFTDVEGDPSRFQVVRIPANVGSFADPSTYETWTATSPGGVVERHGARPAYAWRRGAPTTRPPAVPDAHAISEHLRNSFADVEVGDHIGSVFWNDHVGRYLRISARPFGDDAFLGETWLSVADTPMGPWAWATQVVTHDDYSFYNPRQHPEFDDGSRVYFEGTYAHTFSGTQVPTPAYDYNQVMYRQDLEALALPVPVYGRGLRTRRALREGDDAEPAVFFALDRPADGTVPLRWTGPDCAPRELAEDGAGEVAFHAFPDGDASPHLVPLYPLADPGRGTRYVLAPPPGADPVAWVWPNPVDLPFPVLDHGPARVDAGPDQCVPDGVVRLAASAPAVAEVRWTWDGGEADGAEVSLDLGDGVHVVTVTATAGEWSAADLVVVEVGGRRACGCEVADRGSSTWVAGLVLLGMARRRRRA